MNVSTVDWFDPLFNGDPIAGDVVDDGAVRRHMGALIQGLEPELGHRTVDQKGKPGRQFTSEPGGNPAPLDLSGDISERDAAE